ncbi:MAG: hypothetical protein IT445_05725 [Phycisphaeraceae bacterium]|nr:hypothetical protein [Phycisphaeraceae bacterium]
MPRKKSLNLVIPEDLLRQFNEVSAAFGHGKQKGMVLSAAIAMFLDAPPPKQGQYLEQVMRAEVREGVDRLMDHARAQQLLEQATHLALEKAVGNEPSQMRPRKAAKKKGRPQRGFK